MALGEKLAKKSEEIKATKAEAEKKAKEENLEPIRAKIKELENQMHQLQLVKGSLELKSGGNSGEKTGKGMREYSTETAEQVKKESKLLDTLIEQNKEALRLEGIENRDQLAENPEFAGEEEVVNYKLSLAQAEELKMSDSELQEKLQTLGINIDAENFSFDSALKVVEEKLQPLEKELVQEKLKTPEGKEEVIEMATKKIEEENTKRENISYSGWGRELVVRGLASGYDSFTHEKLCSDNFKPDFKSFKFLPSNIEKYQEMYGRDMAKKAIKSIYDLKINEIYKQEKLSFERSGIPTSDPVSVHFLDNLLKVLKEIKDQIDIQEEVFWSNKMKQEEAMKALEKRTADEKAKEEKLTAARETFKKKRDELLQEIKKGTGYDSNIEGGMPSWIESIERERETALYLMTKLTELESELPKGAVILSERVITVPDVLEELKQLKENIKNEEQNLIELRQKIDKHKANKPGFLGIGKDKWQKELIDLEQRREDLKNKIDSVLPEKRDALERKSRFVIPLDSSDDRRETVKLIKGEKFEGNSSEVFKNLKVKLAEIADRKVPESAMKLYQEYQELQKQLQ